MHPTPSMCEPEKHSERFVLPLNRHHLIKYQPHRIHIDYLLIIFIIICHLGARVCVHYFHHKYTLTVAYIQRVYFCGGHSFIRTYVKNTCRIHCAFTFDLSFGKLVLRGMFEHVVCNLAKAITFLCKRIDCDFGNFGHYQ